MEIKFKKTPLNFTPEGYINYQNFYTIQGNPSREAYAFEVLDCKPFFAFANQNPHLPILISVIYLCVIFSIKNFMTNRKAFHLKRELFIWNALLGIFSIVGFVRFLPDILDNVNQTHGFFGSACIRQLGSYTSTQFWATLFILSKIVELGDTVFIVLRKKPLQFLQWYHHVVTLTLVWITTPYIEAIGYYFILLNYGVHSLMYPYFALSAIGVSVPKPIRNLITMLQLSQMVVGVFLSLYTFYFYYYEDSCDREEYTMKLFLLAYGSFVILFADLFYRLVLKKTKQKGA